LGAERSGSDEDLQGLAGVHGAVAVGHLVEVDGAVEDTAGLDAAFEDVGEEFLDVGAGRGGAAGQGDVAAEEAADPDWSFLVLRDADPADRATGADDAVGLW
jgi:hypothetical protein